MQNTNYADIALKYLSTLEDDHSIHRYDGMWFIMKDGKACVTGESEMTEAILKMDSTLRPIVKNVLESLGEICKTEDYIVPNWLPMQFRSDKEKLFLRKYYTEEEGSKVRSIEVYENYQKWCEENNCRKQPQPKFVKTVIMSFSGVFKKDIENNKKSNTFYVGLKAI